MGYSPDDSRYIEKFLIGKKKFLPKDIEMAGIGIARGEGLYDRFSGRVVFPLFDHRGNPIGFAGRILPWDKRETGKYINSPETPIYHKSSVLFGLNLTRSLIKKKKIAIVVEGELDLISSYQAGIKNVVAIKGSALTVDQVRLLSRFAPKFILALDSDFAGDVAARRGITVAENSGIEVKVAKLSKFKDPDEAARGDIESYKKDLIHAEGVWDYLVDSVFGRFKGETGEGKAKISKEITPILGEIEDKIVQAHYANLIARKLGVPLEAVTEQITKVGSELQEASADAKALEDKTEGRERRDLLEERLLALAFQSDSKILLGKEISGLIQQPLNKKLVAEYSGFTLGKKEFSVSEFGESLPKELFDGFSKMILIDNQGLIDDPDGLKKELDLLKKELRIVTLKDNLKILAIEMREMEESGEEDKLLKAQNQFNKLAKMLANLDQEGGGSIIFNE